MQTNLEFKITHCLFTVTKLTNVKRERAIGLLKANVTPSIVAKRFRCHVRTIGCLNNLLQEIGTTSHFLRPGRRRDVKIELPRRRICAIDFIWSQSQLEHPMEFIIQKPGLKL